MLKQIIRSAAHRFGYDIRGLTPGCDPYWDLANLLKNAAAPTVFDVGANMGQTIDEISAAIPNATTHAFEPLSEAFSHLVANYSRPGLHLNNTAMGAKVESRELLENSWSMMSSFLPPSTDCFGEIERKTTVPVDTIDAYCDRNGVRAIDIIKSDTQGFDLDVLKGARTMLSTDRVHLVFIEIILCDMYQGAPSLADVDSYLKGCGLNLYSLYRCAVENQKAIHTDAIYINPNFGRAAAKPIKAQQTA